MGKPQIAAVLCWGLDQKRTKAQTEVSPNRNPVDIYQEVQSVGWVSLRSTHPTS
jgi:hypothetical protein